MTHVAMSRRSRRNSPSTGTGEDAVMSHAHAIRRWARSSCRIEILTCARVWRRGLGCVEK